MPKPRRRTFLALAAAGVAPVCGQTLPEITDLPDRLRGTGDLRFAIDPTIAAVSTLTIALIASLLAGAHFARCS
jgi:hypothetical protein